MNIAKKTAVCVLTLGLLCTQSGYPAVAVAQENDYASNDTLENDPGEQESTHDSSTEEESSPVSETSDEDNTHDGATDAVASMDTETSEVNTESSDDQTESTAAHETLSEDTPIAINESNDTASSHDDSTHDENASSSSVSLPPDSDVAVHSDAAAKETTFNTESHENDVSSTSSAAVMSSTSADSEEDTSSAVDLSTTQTPKDTVVKSDNTEETNSTAEGVTDEQSTTTEVMELVASVASTSSTSTEDFVSEATSTASSTTTIVSGTSIALANVINLVNSNFVNSEGVVLFSNFFESVFGAIDFREYFANAAAFGCSLLGCQGEHVAVNVNNDASINNDILVTANSGENMIDNAGNGVIKTGNAYAGLNLVNVANTNLVDSNYLLVTLNAFQDLNGDIVFPSLSQFFGSLAGGAVSPAAVTISNAASVANNVNVEADAGGNATTNTGSSAITTGNAVGSSNVFNQLNSSLIGGQSVSVVFRVHGSWAGQVFGAPDNLAWTAGDDGSIYLFDVGGTSHNGNLFMQGTSTARINNNVNVIALTGANAITNAETAVISTGNAYAGANIINVANANVVGRNWILAVINIFGDFNGNIAFGRPDMWVGGQIDVPESVGNGSELGYKLTVINNGDSPASNVKLETKTNGDYLQVESASHAYTQTPEGLEWSLGTIPAGGAAEITYKALVQHAAPGTDIINTAEIKLRETDNNVNDNREVLAITTDAKKGNGIRLELSKSTRAQEVAQEVPAQIDLTVQRVTKDVTLTGAQKTAEQKLIVTNDTNTLARNVVLHDILMNAQGDVIRDEVWELGDVFPREEIELGYTVTFNDQAAYGTYLLSTTIAGLNVDYNSGTNGTIAYEKIALPYTPLLSSLNEALAQVGSTRDATAGTIKAPVYHGDETPLIPTLQTHIAEAASNDQLASASSTGVPLNPIMIFFASVTTLLAFSLLRMYRVL